MYYNLNDIKPYVQNFKYNNGCFTEQDVENLIYEIDKNDNTLDYYYENGISKCVIVPTSLDYVIKIPFNGYYDYVEEGEEYEEEGFISFYGGAGDYDDDYCALEVKIYNEIIVNSKFKEFFLPVEKVYEIKNCPVYIQPKGKIFGEVDNNKYYSKASLLDVQTSQKHGEFHSSLPNIWLASCLDCFKGDMEILKEFINFLAENDFSDLHQGNIGFYHNHPVIIDYAGYNG